MSRRLPPASSSSSPHVLVMDDAPAVLELLREILANEGYQVTARPLRLDRAQIRALHPDLILLELRFSADLESPEQFLSALRRDPILANVPLVLCTTQSLAVQGKYLEWLLDQLHIRVVLKPFALDELLTTVANSLPEARLECPAGCAHNRQAIETEIPVLTARRLVDATPEVESQFGPRQWPRQTAVFLRLTDDRANSIPSNRLGCDAP